MTNLQNLTVAQLHRVLAIKEQIEQLQGELDSIAGGGPATVSKPGRKKRGISAAGRARIAAAQKARWAKVRAGGSKAAEKPVKKKRKVSAAVKAKLAAIAKARWAKVKASGKSKL